MPFLPNSAWPALLALLAAPLPPRAGDVAERLAVHPVLAGTRFARAGDDHNQVFVATVGAQVPTRQAEALAAELLGPVERLASAWQSDFVQALGLPPSAAADGFALVVLGDDRTHEAVLATVAASAPTPELAIFDPALGAIVTRVHPDSPLAPERCAAILRAAAGVWLDRAASGGFLAPSALREGLAGRLALAAVEPGRAGLLDVGDAALLTAAALVPQRRLQTLPSAEQLWSPRDAAAAREWVYERARGLALPGAQSEAALEVFFAQARAWCWFFEHGAEGRYRAGWHTYLGQALTGATRLEALRTALGSDPGDLEREFLDSLFTEHQRNRPSVEIPLDLVAQILDERARAPASVSSARPGGARGGDFDPARLAPSALDPLVQLALALSAGRDGALDPAIARLDAVLVLAAATRDGERVARERARLVALRAARLAWAQGAAATGGRVSLERDGKTSALKVERFEQGVLHFAKNRLDLEQLALEELAPAAVLGTAADLPASAPDWTAAYAHLLAGDERWTREIPDSEAGRALRAEAPEIAGLLRAGAAARELAALATIVLDEHGALDPAAAEVALAALARLSAQSDLELVDAARLELRALAQIALGARHDALGGVPALAGRVGPGPAGTLRLHYEFERAEEADDFELLPEALPDWHASMSPVPKSQADSYFVLRQGAFFGDGQLSYRLRLRFAPPVRVRYLMRYVPRQDDPLDVGVVLVGLGGNGQGTFAAASEFGDVYVTDPGTGHSGRVLFAGERVVEINTLYTCEARLEVDGQSFVIEAWRGDSLRNELPAPNCSGGEVFLFVHSPRIVAFESISIEGLADSSSLVELRAEWIARELVRLGL